MNIVILGAGVIGSYLAGVLSQQKHNVIVIDLDVKALERLFLSLDVATKVGSGTDWRLLEELKHLHPDFFIALSSDDETNLTACAIAKKLGYRKTIARIRQEFFLDNHLVDFNGLFSVDYIIGIEVIVAHEIFKRVLNPGSIAIESFAHGAVQMRTIVIPANFDEANIPLAKMRALDNLLVGLIKRKKTEGEQQIVFPKGHDVLLPQDEVTLIGKTGVMENLHRTIGFPQKTIRSVVLIGGSGVAVHLTRLLEARHIEVKIIEQDEGRSKELARLFPSAIVLNHDGTDLDFLKEENVSFSDVFIACTNRHEVNILAALMGKQIGCPEVITLVSDDRVNPFLRKFEISHTLSERTSIERHIQVILHQETHIALASLYDGQAKIMEVKLTPRSKLIGAPISELRSVLPEDLIIAIVKTKNGIVIPKGNHLLVSGDTAVVICSAASAKELENML